MKSETELHLRLVPKQGLGDGAPKFEEPPEKLESFDRAILSLIAARSTGSINKSTVDSIILALEKAQCPQTVIQRSLIVSVLLLNTEGDASICFKYDVANFGRKSLPSKTHKFWFATPQDDIKLTASTESGLPIELETVESTSTCVEVRAHFPKPLEPAEQIAYRVQYQVKGDFMPSDFYNIRTWGITSKVSLSVFAPQSCRFSDVTMGLESSDGYINDFPPVAEVSNEFGREKLTWHHRAAKTGDLFRTRWTLTQTD